MWALLLTVAAAEQLCESSVVRGQCLTQLRPPARTGSREIPAEQAGECNTEALKNVTLLLHCRQSREICDQRRPLLSAYKAYFKEVRWILAEPGPSDISCGYHQPGDPYFCVANLLEQMDTDSGVLYMHFDALISPCRFSEVFNPQMLGLPADHEYHSYEGHDECEDPRSKTSGCPWGLWTRYRRNFFTAMKELRSTHPELLQGVPQLAQGCWKGYMDFFYLPRKAFPTFTLLARIFAQHNVYMEIAGPNILEITRAIMGAQNYHCVIRVIEGLPVSEIQSRDFRCGHEVHYQDDSILHAVRRILGEPEPAQVLAVETHNDPISSSQWSMWTELPVVCISILALGVATCCLEPFVESLSRRAFSLLLCAVYVGISVIIDLSIARQATDDAFRFEPMCAVLLTETIKLIVSLGLAARRPSYLQDSESKFTQKDVIWLVFAAAIFTLNNILLWWAIGQNDISTFGILRETMILWTAILWRSVFGVELGWTRLAAIGVVSTGLMLNQVQLLEQASWSWACFLILAMTGCNALGSVVNEVALKRHQGILDLNVQNSILYFACIFLTLLTMLLSGRWRSVLDRGFFHGFNHHTMFTVSLQALAGLSVSRILKYADSVQKNIASCLRGPILVLVSPVVVVSGADASTVLSALIVASGGLLYLLQGPLMAPKAV